MGQSSPPRALTISVLRLLLIAVVVGGIGTILVVLIVARAWSEMARLKTLTPRGVIQEPV